MTQRILIVKLADLGDLLLCEPALRSIRLAYPNAHIDILVTPASAELAQLLGHDVHPIVFDKNRFDRLASAITPSGMRRGATLGVNLRRAHYSAVLLLHHLTTQGGATKFRALVWAASAPMVAGLDNGRGSFLTQRVDDLGFGVRHEAEYMLSVARVAGGADVDGRPRYPDEAVADSPLHVSHFVAIHPVTGEYSSARTWQADRWARVASELHSRGLTPVIVGAADARPAAAVIRAKVPEAIDLTAQTTIPQLAGVLLRAACVIGGDSFVGHLAAALNRPTVSVFGPSNADAWRPVGSDGAHVVVRRKMPCQPCIYTGYSLGRISGCTDRTCLSLVTERDVVDRAIAACEATTW